MQEEVKEQLQQTPKKGFARLRQDLKTMTFREKVSHIWTYYRWMLLIPIVLALMIHLIVTTYKNVNTNKVLCGLSVNLQLDDTSRNYLSDNFMQEHSAGYKWEEINLHEVTLRPTTDLRAHEEYRFTLINIYTLAAERELDYALTDGDGISCMWAEESDVTNAFLDLREFFTEEEYQKLFDEGRILVFGDKETGLPYGVDVSGLPLFQQHCTSEGPLFFCVFKDSQRLDTVKTFWNYINTWEG